MDGRGSEGRGGRGSEGGRRGEGGWGEDAAMSHNTVASDLDGDEGSHHYYCPINMGGKCSCSLASRRNNNDYTKLKKSKSKPSSKYNKSNYYHEEAPSPYSNPYNGSYEEQYMDPEAYNCTSSTCTTPPTSSSNENSYNHARHSPCPDCTRCNNNNNNNGYDERGGAFSNCSQCNNAHQNNNNGAYCDYFDPSKTYGGCPAGKEGPSFALPKIQVTAKILFGTVSAITDLKQKKAAKKS